MTYYHTSVAISVPLDSYDLTALTIEAERHGKNRDQLLVEVAQHYLVELHKKHKREEEESERMGGEQ